MKRVSQVSLLVMLVVLMSSFMVQAVDYVKYCEFEGVVRLQNGVEEEVNAPSNGYLEVDSGEEIHMKINYKLYLYDTGRLNIVLFKKNWLGGLNWITSYDLIAEKGYFYYQTHTFGNLSAGDYWIAILPGTAETYFTVDGSFEVY